MQKRICFFLILILLAAALPTVALADGLTEVVIDIKPCKEPNTLNVNQPSLLPVAIYGGLTVDEASLTLQGVPIAEWVYKSGYLLAKFDAQAVISAIGPVNNGDVILLTLEGALDDETPIIGYDEVVILKRSR